MKPRRHQQLLLDIGPEAAPPTLDNFIVGDNHELMARLRTLAESRVYDQIYLWGEAGSGRSHLLVGAEELAAAAGRNTCFMRSNELNDKLHNRGDETVELDIPPGSLIILDDVDELDANAQIALFRIFNTARLVGLALLLAGSQPPLQLALREDLRTRIGATLIYEVHPLSDREKARALHQHAAARGMRVDDVLIDYLLHHGRRDLPSLLWTLNAADQASLEQKRPLTLPLLRAILMQQQQIQTLQSPRQIMAPSCTNSTNGTDSTDSTNTPSQPNTLPTEKENPTS